MRKIIVSNIVSLDGYFEGSGKNVMALFEPLGKLYPTDESFSLYNASRLREASTLLLGRTSYDGFKSYWPNIVNDPNQRPVEREISRLNNAIDKVVISDTLTPDQTAPWHNTRIVQRADAHTAIADLKQQDGQDILMFGSRVLWNDLLAHNLVDELHFMLSPVVLGAGTPAFDGPPPASLRLIDTGSWDGSGLVLVRYEVVH